MEVVGVDSLLKKTVITSDFEKKDGVPPIQGPSRRAREKARKVSAVMSPLSLVMVFILYKLL